MENSTNAMHGFLNMLNLVTHPHLENKKTKEKIEGVLEKMAEHIDNVTGGM